VEQRDWLTTEQVWRHVTSRAAWDAAGGPEEEDADPGILYHTSEHAPDGLRVGIDDGDAARRSVEHAHVHVIPRYP
jgi:hypothetical protein